MITIELPLAVILPRKTKANRKMIINLNNYRNWFYIISNQVKQLYKELLAPQLEWLKLECPLKLHFKLYHTEKKKIDRANVLCIQEKFFCDALVEYWVIPDDNDHFIKETKYTSVISDTPKVTVTIT